MGEPGEPNTVVDEDEESYEFANTGANAGGVPANQLAQPPPYEPSKSGRNVAEELSDLVVYCEPIPFKSFRESKGSANEGGSVNELVVNVRVCC